MTILASINTQGLRSQDRRTNAFTYFQKHRLDIIFLQKTHWSVDIEIQIRREWRGEIVFNHGTDSARGDAILSNSRLSHRIAHTRRDNERCILNRGS